MSRISSIHDALIARLEALFPSHKRLPDAYQVERNPSKFLDQGYAVTIGAASNRGGLLSQQMQVTREMGVVLTRKSVALESDAAKSAACQLALMEDHLLLIKDLETDTTVNTTAAMVEFTSDSGITSIGDGTHPHLVIETQFTVTYFEDLTS
jgi:hypothetical protein